MKGLRVWFNLNTLVALLISLVSSWVCLSQHWALEIDFMMIGLLVVFPLTLGIRLSFKRRETALRQLSRHRASLLAIAEALSITKLDAPAYGEAGLLVRSASDGLLDALAAEDAQTVALRDIDKIPSFLQANRKKVKGANVQKLLLFHAKVSETATAALAIKRHGTPAGLKPFMLLSLLAFLVFYPASLLADTGFDVPLWYVYAMTAFKGVLLATLYNIHAGLEDPFLPGGLDSIRLGDFRITAADIPVYLPKPDKKDKDDGKEDDDED